MTYRTVACVMALIVGLAVPAGAASFLGGVFDEPIFQADAYKQLVNFRTKPRGVVARNFAVRAGAQNDDILAATTGKGGSVNIVDNALLVSVNGNETGNKGIRSGNNYNKTIVASLNCFKNTPGVANVNITAGNLNTQITSYSGPDLSSGLLASGGSTSQATSQAALLRK